MRDRAARARRYQSWRGGGQGCGGAAVLRCCGVAVPKNRSTAAPGVAHPCPPDPQPITRPRMELRGTTVAVTGATGFLGRYIVRSLLERGARVVGVVRNPDKGRDLAAAGLSSLGRAESHVLGTVDQVRAVLCRLLGNDVGPPGDGIRAIEHGRGRAALAARLTELGYPLDPAALDRVFARFKEIADRRKQVTDADLEAIVRHDSPPDEAFTLDALHVGCGTLHLLARQHLDIARRSRKRLAKELEILLWPLAFGF